MSGQGPWPLAMEPPVLTIEGERALLALPNDLFLMGLLGPGRPGKSWSLEGSPLQETLSHEIRLHLV